MKYLLFIFVLVACGKQPEVVDISGKWFRDMAGGMEVVDVKDTSIDYYSCPTKTSCNFSFSTDKDSIEASDDTIKIGGIVYKRLE